MVMKGSLFYYDLRAVSFTSSDFASDYIVKLGVEVEVIDKINDKPYIKNKFTTKWPYKATSDIVNTESARLAALEEAYKSGKGHVIGKYGLETYGTEKWRAEFFACATEAFFERSTRLKKECPSIYTALRSFYQLDPANWDIPT